jgi:hypothetical protein
MSITSLSKPKVHWSERARGGTETIEPWFEFLGGDNGAIPLSVAQAADTWYIINDSDVTFPVDPAPGLGLDTWDF